MHEVLANSINSNELENGSEDVNLAESASDGTLLMSKSV